MTINQMISTVIAIVVATTITLFTVTHINLNSNETAIKQQIKLSSAVATLKDARYYVVQVQQFLTDIGATRSNEALPEAKASLDGAINSFEHLIKILPDQQEHIKKLERQLNMAYTAGVKMGDAYINLGTEAGNKMMKGDGGLDDESSKLAEELDNLSLNLEKELDESAEKALKSIDNAGSIILVSLIVSAVLTLISILILRRRILPNLHRLDESLNNIASGSRDLTLRLKEDGNDELTAIAKSFNRFISSINALILDTQNKAFKLAEEGEQMSQSSQQTSKGMALLEAETQKIAVSIDEMQQTVHYVTEGAVRTADSAKQSDTDATQVEKIVGASVASISQLAKDVQQASEALLSLEENTANVGSILDVIRGIADQTNLLALNAAIEAARAGEYGRGFAVVADEVRTLARRTQESTEQIQTMISQLQQGAHDAVTVMANSRTQAETTVAEAHQASAALSRITLVINDISSMANEIATSMEQQHAVSDSINDRIQSIRKSAETTSVNAEQSRSASKEVLGYSSDLSKAMGAYKVK
ncbi:methyl-accepting chemotaxis protein [Marinomonas sp. 15G1-11]|uniref:Methyl-accepting chemotaxis protein n=1 Tax=Marinomonas phaeophyticola TaxID=3004091 RepID=A0ABT4JUW6_9GAMM|nr:methyl-accepting chemotaxis protein [Marinomonas sp. 15G1-11]MCZ2722184.1 methyl-accepting chemotaxis protein [Marinomonas sp. 15G1-11]